MSMTTSLRGYASEPFKLTSIVSPRRRVDLYIGRRQPLYRFIQFSWLFLIVLVSIFNTFTYSIWRYSDSSCCATAVAFDMHFILCVFVTAFGFAYAQNTSVTPTHSQLKKRGLCYVWPQDSDNEFWNSDRSPMTWYYNYNALPTYGLDSQKLEFVPMLWGNRASDSGFYDAVKGLIDSGNDIKYVLGFNEPDGCDGGSSCVDPGPAAKAWKQEIEPLKEHGVKLGAPAVRPGGSVWLQEFFTECKGGCTVDFMPAHYYGDATGLENWVNFLRDTYQNISDVWVTEFACPDCTLLATEQSFNESVIYMDQAS